jgi:hypothetical protein
MMVLARAVAGGSSASILGSLVLGSSIRQSSWTGETGRQAICFREWQVSRGTRERGGHVCQRVDR